jgi:hypothetical protein
MRDKLQKFIDENKDAFDASEPQPQVWNKVEQQITKRQSFRDRFRSTLLLAASFAAITVLSVTLFTVFQKSEKKEVGAGTPAANETTEIIDILDPIQARQISQFHEVIELKQNELKLLEKEEPQLYKEFVSDINSLDSAYTALKAQLPENPNREMILEAMIQNLQLQSDLLTRHLRIIKEIKQKTKGHEKQIS